MCSRILFFPVFPRSLPNPFFLFLFFFTLSFVPSFVDLFMSVG